MSELHLPPGRYLGPGTPGTGPDAQVLRYRGTPGRNLGHLLGVLPLALYSGSLGPLLRFIEKRKPFPPNMVGYCLSVTTPNAKSVAFEDPVCAARLFE